MEKIFSDVTSSLKSVMEQASKVIVGQTSTLKQLILALLCDANVLLEGYPGLAKTLSVRTLAQLMELKFSRIQGTPDLMPSDITGTYVLEEKDGKRDFKFQPGPVFANIVLFDEINRTNPKTQASLLEAMQEKQVTVGNKTFKLDKPFFVLATMNPIEQEGSLTLNQPVLTNRGLFSGNELYRLCILDGTLVQNGTTKLFQMHDLATLSLNDEGKLQSTRCYPYFTPYTGEVLTIKTRGRREIEVTANHPFLVYRNGEIFWKKAYLLDKDDLLISPKYLELPEGSIELTDHKTCLRRLSEEFTIVTHEELVRLQKDSKNFKYFKHFSGKDFDKLRISRYLLIKELTRALHLGKNFYWQMIRYLRRGTSNRFLKAKLTTFFQTYKPDLSQVKDYFESWKINSICRISFDEDLAFWTAFVHSDGSFNNTKICVFQKNYPEVLNRFLAITEKKLGIRISQDYTNVSGVRNVVIGSKPLVRYFTMRFGFREGSGKRGPPLPPHFVLMSAALRREFLRTFISLKSHHVDVKQKRISTTQANKQTLIILSYLLMAEKILSSIIRRPDGAYYLLTQGQDLSLFLEKIGWIDRKKRTVAKKDAFSLSRLVPLCKADVIGFVELLGLYSFHTLKPRQTLTRQDWYCAYLAARKGKPTVSEDLYRKMVIGFTGELEKREALQLTEMVTKNPRYVASLCGLSITEIAHELNVSHNLVWSMYSGKTCSRQKSIEEVIIKQFRARITVARKLLQKIAGFLSEDVCYEKLVSISYRKYDGLVFGLTTPELHNYIGGVGPCGINHNTMPLPEAQSDRFLFKVKTDYPSFDEELEIVSRYTDITKVPDLKPIVTKEQLFRMQDLVRKIPVANDIKKFAVELVTKSRVRKELIEYGASPRASIGLILAAKANALFEGRSYVTKDDIKEVSFPILRHRIILNFEAERNNFNEDDVIKYLLR